MKIQKMNLIMKNIEKSIEKLAKDEKFQKAKNNAQRVFIAKKILDKEITGDSYKLEEIIEQAKAMYELELKDK